MNTPTHILLGAAIFARPGDWKRNLAAVAGGLIPDLSIYVMWVTAKFVSGIPDRIIWSQLHFSPFWQSLNAISNSVPLYLAILAVCLWRKWVVGSVFAAAALIHMVTDFLLHNSDAHRHFWPLSDWRFISPVSYWNPRHYGDIAGLAEAGLAVLLIVILWRRFALIWVRSLLALALLSFIAVPAYFTYFI